MWWLMFGRLPALPSAVRAAAEKGEENEREPASINVFPLRGKSSAKPENTS